MIINIIKIIRINKAYITICIFFKNTRYYLRIIYLLNTFKQYSFVFYFQLESVVFMSMKNVDYFYNFL